MRIAVVGTGIVGASVGRVLARRGAEVLLLDAGDPGAGVTNWSFSWVNAGNKTQTRSYFDLNVAGVAAYRQLAHELGPDGWWHETGHLRWCEDERATLDLVAAVELQRSWGYHAEVWNGREVRQRLEPDVSLPDDAMVAWHADEGWVDGRGLVGALVDDAVRCGASTVFGCAVTDITVKGDRVIGLVCADGSRHGVDAVVNASGPTADAVAGLVGRTLPLRDEPGLVARVRCRAVPVRRAMHAPHVEIRPDGPGRVVLHSRDIDAMIGPAADAGVLAGRLLALARAVVPALGTAELMESRIARRPIPIDGFPSVGAVAGAAGYVEAVTHSGITLGPVIGRLLAAELLDEAVHPLLAPYRPDRFSGSGPPLSAGCD
jgi:glycine/D-amino acid oxidase-like deaminating enzyme